MAEFFTQFTKQAGAVFKKLDAKQKLVVALVSIISIIVIVYLMAWTGERQWTVLYSNLQTEDAQAIVEYLQENDIPYQLESEGTAIMVQQGTELEMRMEVVSNGLITGGVVGYELFDTPSLGVTDFMQQVNYKRSLEGELARTIMKLEMIEFTRISIVIPKPSLFVEDEQPATASVMLQIKAGEELGSEQINSIANLVSHSVEGLKPANVSIVDSYGNDLSQVIHKDPLLEMRADQLKIQRSVELELKNRLDRTLSEAMGPNNALVDVAVEMDFTQANTTSRTYGPAEPLVRSEEREETSGGATDTLEQPSTAERTTTNNELNETIRNSVETFGTLSRISVSVMVNGTFVTDAAGNLVYQDRSPAELAAIQQSVTNAIGIDLGRGDQISIVPFRFDTSVLDLERQRLTAQQREDMLRRILQWIMMAVAAIAFVFVLRSVFHSLDLLLPKPKPKPAIDIEAEAIEEEISAEAQRRTQMLDQVSKFTKEKPSNVASLLNTWLIEEKA